MHDDPKATPGAERRPGWPEERCVLCGRRTNHGIYVEDALIQEVSRD